MSARLVHTEETFPQRLKRLRELAGLSQRQLAEKCGWLNDQKKGSQSVIANYEAASGPNAREPTLSRIIEMATMLEVPPAFLAFGERRDIPPMDAHTIVAKQYGLTVDSVRTALQAVASHAAAQAKKGGRRKIG